MSKTKKAKTKAKKPAKPTTYPCDFVASNGDPCGYEAKTRGGLATHKRKHVPPKGAKKHHPPASIQGLKDSEFIHEDTHRMSDTLDDVAAIPADAPTRQEQERDIIQASFDEMVARSKFLQSQHDNCIRKALKASPELWGEYQRVRAAQTENAMITSVMQKAVIAVGGNAALEYTTPSSAPATPAEAIEQEAVDAVDASVAEAMSKPVEPISEPVRRRPNADAEELAAHKAEGLCVWKDRGRGWCTNEAAITDDKGQAWCKAHAAIAMGG